MPYSRRSSYRSRRRRYVPRRRYTKKAPGYFSMANSGQVIRDVAMLKNLINTEFKTDNTATSTSPDSAGFIKHVNSTPLGDASGEREGQQVRYKSLQMQGQVTIHPSQSQTTVRSILFIYKNSNRQTPTVLDLLTTASVNALKADDNKRNFVVLQDRTINLSTNMPRKTIKMYKKIDLKTFYARGETGGSWDVTEYGGIGHLLISNQTTDVPSLVINYRNKYIDN